MKKFILPFTVVGIVIFAACSQKTTPAKTETPTATPTAIPKPNATTYNGTVQALIQAKCAPCHVPSKGGNKANFDNYVSAQKFGADMIKRIELMPGTRGFMPFKSSTQLSADDIAVFKKWVSDGSVEK